MHKGDTTGQIADMYSRRNLVRGAGTDVETVVVPHAAAATHCGGCGGKLAQGNRRTCKRGGLHKRGNTTTNQTVTLCLGCYHRDHKDGKHTAPVAVR